jgi:hypothetical protein
MVPHNIPSIFVDALAVIVESCKEFNDNGGQRLYKKPARALTNSSRWKASIAAGKRVFEQVLAGHEILFFLHAVFKMMKILCFARLRASCLITIIVY